MTSSRTSITKKVSKSSKTTTKKKSSSVREEEIIDEKAAQEEAVQGKDGADGRDTSQEQGGVSTWQFEDSLKSSVMAAAKQRVVSDKEKDTVEQEKESYRGEEQEAGMAVQLESSVTDTRGMKMSRKKVSGKKTVISKSEEQQSGEEGGDEEEPSKPDSDKRATSQKVQFTESANISMEQKSSTMTVASTKISAVSGVREEAVADSEQLQISQEDASAEDAAEALATSGATDLKKKKKKIVKKTELVEASPGSDALEKVAATESKTISMVKSEGGKSITTVVQQSVETATPATGGLATAETEQTKRQVTQKISIVKDVQPKDEGTTTTTETQHFTAQSGAEEMTTTTSTSSSSGSKKIVKKRVVTKKTTVTAKGEAAPLYEERTSDGEMPLEQGPIITESDEPPIATEPSPVIEEEPEDVYEAGSSPVIEEAPGDEEVIEVEESKPVEIEEAGDDEVQEVPHSGIREISTAIVTEPEDLTDNQPKEREETKAVSSDQDKDTTLKTTSKTTKKVVVKQKVAVHTPERSGIVQPEQTQGEQDDKVDMAVKESFMQEHAAAEEQIDTSVIKKKKVVKKKIIKVGSKTADAEKGEKADETIGEEHDRASREVSFESHERASIDTKTERLQEGGYEHDQTASGEEESEAAGYQHETTEVIDSKLETSFGVKEPSSIGQQKVTTKKVQLTTKVTVPSDDSTKVIKEQPTKKEPEQPKVATIGKIEKHVAETKMTEPEPVQTKPYDEAFKPKKKSSVPRKDTPKEEQPAAPFAVKLKKTSRVKQSWDEDKLETVDLKHHEFEKLPQEEALEREGMVVATEALKQETIELEQLEGQKKLKLKKQIKSKAIPKLETDRDSDLSKELVNQAPDEPMEVDSVEPIGSQQQEPDMVSIIGA